MWLAICWSYFGLWRRAGWPRLWRKTSSAGYRLVESESCLVCVNWESTGHYRYCLSCCQLYVLVPLPAQVPCTPENCIWCNLTLLPRPCMITHFYVSWIISGPNSQSGCVRAGAGSCSLISGDVWCCSGFFLSLQHCRPWMKRGEGPISVICSTIL